MGFRLVDDGVLLLGEGSRRRRRKGDGMDKGELEKEKFLIPYFSTSSKCFRCCMMTSRCFSSIARAMKRWNWLL